MPDVFNLTITPIVSIQLLNNIDFNRLNQKGKTDCPHRLHEITPAHFLVILRGSFIMRLFMLQTGVRIRQ